MSALPGLVKIRSFKRGPLSVQNAGFLTQYQQFIDAMATVAHAPPLAVAATGGQLLGLPINPKDEHSIFIRIDMPQGTRVGTVSEFDVTQTDSATGRLLGGSRYRVVVNRKK